MRVILCAEVWYELTREEPSGFTTSSYYRSVDVAAARKSAMSGFLRNNTGGVNKPEEEYRTLYCHDALTGQRLTLICTGTLGQPFDAFRQVLETELTWFNREDIAIDVALYQPGIDPDRLTIVLNKTSKKIRGTPRTAVMIASHHHVFIPTKQLKTSYKVV